MRRNVRRLNREIGHHAASLSNPTAVIPLSIPSSYQPRKAYEKKGAALQHNASAGASLECMDGEAAAMMEGALDGSSKTNARKSAKTADGVKKKGVRKAVNLSGTQIYLPSSYNDLVG